MFLCFFKFLNVFFVFSNVVFLLFLKQKRTKFQIWCISHGHRLHFLDRASVLYQYYWFLGRPEPPFRTGLCFTADVFFFFIFSPHFLRDPSTDRTETLPHDQKLAEFYKLTSKIRGRSPQKIGGKKHAKFRSTLDHFRLWSRISPEWGNISKIGKTYELGKFLLRLMKKVRWTLVN